MLDYCRLGMAEHTGAVLRNTKRRTEWPLHAVGRLEESGDFATSRKMTVWQLMCALKLHQEETIITKIPGRAGAVARNTKRRAKWPLHVVGRLEESGDFETSGK